LLKRDDQQKLGLRRQLLGQKRKTKISRRGDAELQQESLYSPYGLSLPQILTPDFTNVSWLRLLAG
jgi:hypothetical protein